MSVIRESVSIKKSRIGRDFMKRRFVSLLPLLVVLAIFFGLVLFGLSSKYVKATLTKSGFSVDLICEKAEDGLDFIIDINNDGPLQINLALVRIRLTKNDEYIWFSNWDFRREEEAIPSGSSKRYTLSMELPKEKFEEIINEEKIGLNVTGVYEIKEIGDMSFAYPMEVRLGG